MAKFYDVIGYVNQEVVRPGVVEEVATENYYYGEVTRDSMNLQTSNEISPDVMISSSVSIIADPYAMSHISNMRYVRLWGVYWSIKLIEPVHPRIILRLGGVYNGPKAPAPDAP